MIGILLITHDTLGEDFIHCATHILGKRPDRLSALSVSNRDDPIDILPKAKSRINDLDEGQGVLILTDIYGASPSNLTAKLIVPGKIEGIAGINLPMLVRALTYRERGLTTMIAKAISGGCEGILQIKKEA